jgi:hypothetical protein
MNENTPEKKAVRLDAIVVFLAIIIVMAWLAVQIVNFAPRGFNSLASLAEGIDQYRKGLSSDIDGPLVVASDMASTTDGNPVTITWEKDTRAGRYTFSHACHDGIILDIVDTDGLREITCDTAYDIGDVGTLTFMINSEAKEAIAVPYTIAFMRKNDTGPIRMGGGSVTIGNDAPVVVATNDDDDGTVLGENDSKDFAAEPPATPKPTVAPAPKPKPRVTVPTTPKITYVLPTSNPQGYIDLTTSMLQTGTLSGNTFKAGTIEKGEDGAIRFSIKNNGTKISGKWTYSVTLPDNDTYTSPLQAPLMPTEEVIITIGFGLDDATRHTFTVTAAEANDAKLSNNTASKQATFTR